MKAKTQPPPAPFVSALRFLEPQSLNVPLLGARLLLPSPLYFPLPSRSASRPSPLFSTTCRWGVLALTRALRGRGNENSSDHDRPSGHHPKWHREVKYRRRGLFHGFLRVTRVGLCFLLFTPVRHECFHPVRQYLALTGRVFGCRFHAADDPKLSDIPFETSVPLFPLPPGHHSLCIPALCCRGLHFPGH